MSGFTVNTPAWSPGRRAGESDGREPVPFQPYVVCQRQQRAAAFGYFLGAEGGPLDLEQEFGVALGALHPVQEHLQRLLRLQCVQHPAELPDDLQLVRGQQQFLLARARGVHVDGREDPLVSQVPAQPQFHVAGALELLEDDLFHPRAGLDQGGGQDRERAAVLDVARRAEELLRRVEGRGVHAAGQDPAAGRGGQVVRPPEPGDGVEQHDDVVAHLYQALGPLDRQFRDRGVVLGGAVEGRVDHFALDRPLHIGDLFWPLVHEHDHEVAFGVVLGDRVRDGLQDHRLAGLRRRYDEATLALADRGDEVNDPRGHDAGIGLQAEPVLRVQRHQLGELRPDAGGLRVEAVYLVQADQRVELLPALPLAGLAHGALDDVALAQAVPAHLGQRHVDVVGPGQVAGGADERVVVKHVEDARDRDKHVVLGDHRLGVTAALAAAPVAVAEPVSVPAAATVVVVPAAALVLRTAAALVLRTTASGARVPALVGPLFRAVTAGLGVVAPRVVVAAAPLTTLAVPG